MLVRTKPYKIYQHAFDKIKRGMRVISCLTTTLPTVVYIAFLVWLCRTDAQMPTMVFLPAILLAAGPMIFLLSDPLKGVQQLRIWDQEGSVEFTEDYFDAKLTDGSDNKTPWSRFDRAGVKNASLVLYVGNHPVVNVPEAAFATGEDRETVLRLLERKGLLPGRS